MLLQTVLSCGAFHEECFSLPLPVRCPETFRGVGMRNKSINLLRRPGAGFYRKAEECRSVSLLSGQGGVVARAPSYKLLLPKGDKCILNIFIIDLWKSLSIIRLGLVCLVKQTSVGQLVQALNF